MYWCAQHTLFRILSRFWAGLKIRKVITMGLITKIFGTYSERELKRILPIVSKIEALEDEYRALSDADLQAKTAEFKSRLAQGETQDDILPEA